MYLPSLKSETTKSFWSGVVLDCNPTKLNWIILNSPGWMGFQQDHLGFLKFLSPGPMTNPWGGKEKCKHKLKRMIQSPMLGKLFKHRCAWFLCFFVLCGSHIIWWLEVTTDCHKYIVLYFCCFIRRSSYSSIFCLLVGLQCASVKYNFSWFDCSAQPQSIAISDDVWET